MDQRSLAASQFGSTAAKYLTSAVHASGADLERLTAIASTLRVSNVLDLGCGAGHASFALARAGVHRVVACDVATQMLDVVASEATARGHVQIETREGSAEHSGFVAATFDMVVTRYSAHHWLDVGGALDHVAHILKPGGVLVVIDVLAPENPLLDTVLQTVEILRDKSHVRDYRESEWRSMLRSAQFSEPVVDHWKLAMEFENWVARIGTSMPRIDALKVLLTEFPSEARDYYAVGKDYSFVIDSGWFQAAKR